MKAVVEKPFPFAEDGVNTRQMQKGDEVDVAASMIAGLERDGYVKRLDTQGDEGDETLRVAHIEIDRVLAAASDSELKTIIARSGKPYSGNLVHAKMVGQAKAQMLKEAAGEKVKKTVDPESGVTEQPLAKPGEATPPSAKSDAHTKHSAKK